MNPSSKGWLKQFENYYLDHLSLGSDIVDPNKSIYNLLADSSLLFSIPLRSDVLLHSEYENWNFKEQFRVNFVFVLFRISEIFIKSKQASSKLTEVYHRLPLANESNLDVEDFIEQICKAKNDNLFINSYNINVWAFYYLIEFYYFLEKRSLPSRKEVQIDIVKGMIVAANSNNEISKLESRLISRYIDHAKFDKEVAKDLYKLIDINTKLQLPSFSDDKLLIKKIAYDLALLALMTDYEIDEPELQFINTYATHLSISLKEQYTTFSRIQNLHLNHCHQLAYLHKSHSVKLIRGMVKHNFKYVLKKNSSMIVNEVKESQELVQLLRKSVDDKLSDDEKKIVRSQVLDLLKTIPSLAIFMIPGGTILLPILMKILPQELLYPSSFLNKK